MEELEEHIDNILKATIARLKEAYDSRKESSPNVKREECFTVNDDTHCRLVFPIKRDNQTRISEQELRFAFVEAFNEYCKESKLPLFYSVETPTRCRYDFSDEPENCSSDDDKGESGNFDLAIYDEKGKRICLIEFKAHNTNPKKYKKDFVKLDNPEEDKNGNVKRYFINILRKTDNGTIPSLEKKVEKINTYTNELYSEKRETTTFFYFVLEDDNPQLQEIQFQNK